MRVNICDPDTPPEPLDHLLSFGAGDSPALITKSATLTYAEAEGRVSRLAGALTARGLSAGDRIASWLDKDWLACLLPLAAARAGLIHVPVNPVLRRAQLAYILADSGARALITGSGRADALGAGDLDRAALILDHDLIADLAGAAPLPPGNADRDSLAAILYTSGSTGRPKGVMLSHANLTLGARAVAHYLALTPDDRTLAVLPLAFDYGQNQLFSTWRAGGTVVPLDYLLPREVMKAVARQRITTLAAVPPLWRQLAALDWGDAGTGIRRITNSGGALTPALIARLQEVFRSAEVFPMYGLTEAFRATFLPPGRVAAKPASIGSAIPYAEIMVVAADGTEAATDQPGELVQAGPLVAKGYWRDKDRTAARFRPAPAWSRTGGMAVWSGDTVVRDADGDLTFVGRDDEMIKTQGYRVSPLEVEEAALACAAVTGAVAFGIADPMRGQAIALAVMGDAARHGALAEALKHDLPAYMVPVRIDWHEALPVNANGKLDRTAIRLAGAAVS